ncbi:MAG: phosphodiester glycosidase family protein [Ferrimicrobium sp.]
MKRRRSLRFRRLRAAVVGVFAVGVLVVGYSLVSAVTAPGGASVGVKVVEWIRGHGGASFVRFAENTYYSLNAPPVGGVPPKGALTPVKTGDPSIVSAKYASLPHLPAPSPVRPFVSPALPGEGKWTPEGHTVDGVPGVYVTLMRPDAVHTSLVAGLAWMDPHVVNFLQFAGAQVPPGGGPWPYMAPIPAQMAPSVVAAFNSGFRMQDSNGGYYAYGKAAVPLRNGAASFVIYRNGAANVVLWKDGARVPSNDVVVRQNLIPLIYNGRVNPQVYSSNYTEWGATVNNQVLVWRSGIGITANGAVIYASGPGLSVGSLANLLYRAGAVRAMELDINSAWTNYFYFNPAPGQPAAPSNGTRLVYNMMRPPLRYFEGTARDFVVAELRSAPTRLSGSGG